mgnify:CR=1 FL=1
MNVRIIPRLDIKGQNLVKGIHMEGLRVLGTSERFADYYYKNGADELFYQDVVASLYQRNSLLELVEKTANAIESALNKAEEQAEIEIESAWIGITGEHVKGINCSGTITISNNEFMNPAGEKITKESINNHSQILNKI